MTAFQHDRVADSVNGTAQADSNEKPVGQVPPDERALVAVDLGAESCRVSLLQWRRGDPVVRLVHRFANAAVQESSSLRWDINGILKGVEHGLRLCAELAPEGIAAIGVDGWAVDYVRLKRDGTPVADPFCYRDPRNGLALEQVHTRISPERLYALTGVQILPLNTLYQLYADGMNPIDQAASWLNLPEFVLYQLGGKRVAEYTNASHTQLLSLETLAWCPEIFEAAGLDLRAAPAGVKPGSDLGRVEGALGSLPAFRDTRLIAPACHDTASAIAGIPAHGDDWAFISSGTWSLVGSVLDSPCTVEAARRKNFSNEGGVGGKINFLKNVNGMWLLRQCMDHWQSQGQRWTVDELIHACAELPAPAALLDVDDSDLLNSAQMPRRINEQLVRAGHSPIPEGPEMAPRIAGLIFHSLAARYADVLRDLSNITGKTLRRLHIVGGGSKNSLLNQLTAEATGLEVIAGPSESTTLGNFAIQLASLRGQFVSEIGVSAPAVAHWAGVLAAKPVELPLQELQPAVF